MKKVIISTDIGSDIDDALALMIALRHPEIDLKAVYTTNGNVEVRAKIAKRMIDLANHSTIVATGEAEPLDEQVRPYHTGLEKYCVPEQYKDKSLSESGIIEDGVSDLSSRINEGQITIASLAPLTNLAMLLERNPKASKKIESVYVMGGRLNAPEHNFRHDVLAAKRVLNSDLSVVLVTADLCGRYKRRLTDFDSMPSPLGSYTQDMLQKWVTFNLWKAYTSEMLGNEVPMLERQSGQRVPSFIKHFIEGLIDFDFLQKHPQQYLQAYALFIEVLKAREESWGKGLIKKVESIFPTEVAVHDAYTIYCIAHQDRIKLRPANVSIERNGEMYISSGTKHQIVEDIDFNHFREFLTTYLK